MKELRELACGDATDSVLTGLDVSPRYRLDDLLMRRRLAALAGQWRTVQRYTKKLKLFCAAFGIDASIAENEPKKNGDNFDSGNRLYNHRVARDKNGDEADDSVHLQVASYDTKWIRGQTARSLAELATKLHDRGYFASRATQDGVSTWTFSRANNLVELRLIGGTMWCASASVNGERLPLFDFRASADSDVLRGVPVEIASERWDGTISSSHAQEYAASWAKLLRHVDTI